MQANDETRKNALRGGMSAHPNDRKATMPETSTPSETSILSEIPTLSEVLAALDTGSLLLAALAVALAGLVRGFAGFGAALVMAPVLALLYGVTAAVPMMSAMEVPALFQIARIARRETDWRRTGPMAVTAVLAIPVGATVLVALDPELLRRGISVIVLLLVVIMAVGGLPPLRRTRPRDVSTAALAGVMGGATGIGGPPLILYFLATGDPAKQVRGDLFGYFLVTSLVGLATFFAYGLFTLKTVTLGLALSVPYMLGMQLGSKLFPLASEKTFRRIALVILACVGAGTLMK